MVFVCSVVKILLMRRIFVLRSLWFLMSSGGAQAADAMNAVAERYVHLVLALGQRESDYVDAFYGPPEWKTQAEKEKKSLDAIGAEAAELSATLAENLDAARLATRCSNCGANICRNKFAALAARVPDVEGRKIKVRRRVARALRRRCANFPDSHFDRDHCPTGGKDSRRRVRCGSAARNGGSRL